MIMLQNKKSLFSRYIEVISASNKVSSRFEDLDRD
jgi:hypothetical protein